MASLLACSASLAGFKPKASILSFSARGSCYKTRAVSKRGIISVQAAAAPISWSVSDYDDVLEEKYKCEMIKQCKIGMSATAPIESMMTVEVVTTTPKTKLTDAKEAFGQFSGMPVICPHDGTLLGVVSRKDLHSTWDQATVVMDVMSRPAITVQPHNTIQDAACLMLKYKIHRLPVVDASNVCVGIVTRSDIFSALGMFH